MARIVADGLCTEVPDDQEYKEKGLPGRMDFTVMWQSHPNSPKVAVGRFALEPMPGCCGVVVSTDSALNESHRAWNLGSRFRVLKERVAAHFGYKTMLMTTQLRNIPEVVGASKAGWKFFHFFRNTRTDNDIGIAVKDL